VDTLCAKKLYVIDWSKPYDRETPKKLNMEERFDFVSGTEKAALLRLLGSEEIKEYVWQNWSGVAWVYRSGGEGKKKISSCEQKGPRNESS